MDEDLHRLALTMRLLGRPQGELLEPRVEKGLFLSRCIPEDVAAIWSLLAANCLSQEDDVCVLFEEASRSEPVPPLDVFASLSGLPLPLWAKRLQHVVLTTATRGGDGWGVELFASRRVGASLGAHFDNDDVYTFQLAGSKEWTLDPPDYPRLLDLIQHDRVERKPSETWAAGGRGALDFQEGRRITLDPGDFLALPAFSLHRVVAVTGPCLSFNATVRQEGTLAKFKAAIRGPHETA